jgi:predicted transcriptional regulator
MPDVIMSLKSKYAEAIYNGIKTVELRAVAPVKSVGRIWIYETSPKRMITGHFTPGNVSLNHREVNSLMITYTSEQLIGREAQPWQLRKELGDRWYKVIEVIEPTRLLYPVTPTSCGWPGKAWRSPESWRYVTEEENAFLRLRDA